MLAIAVAAVLAGGVQAPAQAAGLGRLTVQSALGQPLRAEVEITATSREELATLSARLASQETFRQAGMEMSPALGSLRFAVDRRPDGRAILRITSNQPINEPFVDLLVELNWAAGRFVREYTFLLDPPELRMGRESVEGKTVMSQVAPPAVAASAPPAPGPGAQPARPAAVPPPPQAVGSGAAAAVPRAATVAPQPSAASASQAAQSSVTVERGDTLASIAERVKPADVAVEQAIISIYQANPQAFFGSVHQLRAGRTLSIPDQATMQAVDTADARRQIRMQAADFNAYRARLANAARKVDVAEAGTSASGAVTARIDEAGAPASGGDQLRISRSTPTGGTTGAGTATGTAGGQSAAEATVAGEAALREQSERVALLEKNLADLQRLLELKNQQLAQLQQQAEAVQQGARGATGTIAPAAGAAAAAGAPASSGMPAAPSTTAASATSSSTAAPVTAATPAASDVAASGTTFSTAGASTDASSGAASSSGTSSSAPAATAAASTPPATPAAAEPAKPAAAPAVESGLVDDLLASPYTMPGLTALLVALGAYGWYTMRRRRKAENFEDSLIAADAFTANSLFGTTGGQAVDTNSPSMFGPSVRDTSSDTHSTEVDPIAEAEVYIAYGRETQAEEILREALKRQPERQAIRLKLLEICAGRKDAAGFGVLAREMYAQTAGRNEEWAKVVTLGLALDPDNPLYSGGPEVPAIADFDGASGGEPGAPVAGREGTIEQAFARGHGDHGRELAVGVPPQPQHRADGKPRVDDFAETQAMDGKPADEPPMDFSLEVDTALGRADVDAKDSDGTSNASSDLEQAIGGRFELPSLDFADFGATTRSEPAGSSPKAGKAPVADLASDESGRDETPAFGEFGSLRIELPALDALNLKGAGNGSALDHEIGALDIAALEEVPAVDGGSPVWQEMATKLDLASAYEEIGDKDGARELLEEVIRGGDGDQKRKAQAMLASIG